MGFCEALMATSRVMANQNTIARTLKETHFIWFIFKNMIEKLDRNYLGFCEPLIAPSGVTANQNTNIRTINRIYFYIILIGKYNLKKYIYRVFIFFKVSYGGSCHSNTIKIQKIWSKFI